MASGRYCPDMRRRNGSPPLGDKCHSMATLAAPGTRSAVRRKQLSEPRGWPHPPMAPWPTILNELTEAHWLPTAIDPRTQPGTGAAMPVALPLSDRRTHTRHTMSWGPRLFAVGSRLWPHAQERSKSVMNRGRTLKALHGRQEASQSTIHRALAHHRPFPASGVNFSSELVAKHHG